MVRRISSGLLSHNSSINTHFFCLFSIISIGSLAKEMNEPGVQNMTVKDVTFVGTQNGVRIKSWGRPSHGFVKNVIFQHCTMINVQNPIIIDQNYCPNMEGCPGKVSYIILDSFSLIRFVFVRLAQYSKSNITINYSRHIYR